MVKRFRLFIEIGLIGLLMMIATSAKTTHAQSPIIYYIFNESGQCTSLMSGSEPADPESVFDSVAEGEWFYQTHSVVSGGGESVDYDEYYTVCPSDGVSHTIQYDMEAAGSGGYYVNMKLVIRIDSAATYIENVNESEGGVVAGCVTGSETVSGDDTRDIITGANGGWVIRNSASSDERHCNETPEVHGHTYLRFWEGGELESTPTPAPTPTVAPCPDGYVYQDGECVDLACFGVICPPGHICINGQCIPDEWFETSAMDSYNCLNPDPDLLDPINNWETSAAYVGDVVTLFENDYIKNKYPISLTGGPYRFVIYARSCTYTVLSHPLNEHNWYVDGDCHQYAWTWSKTYANPTNIYLGINVDPGQVFEIPDGLRIDYICVYPDIPTVTPTATPTPTPNHTPTPPVYGCDNPDPEFELNMWTPSAGAYYDAAHDRYYMPPGSVLTGPSKWYASGEYAFQFRGHSDNNGNTVRALFDPYLYWSVTMTQDQDQYLTRFDMRTPGGHSGQISMYAYGSNPGTIYLDGVCMKRLWDSPTATPAPTGTPEPTQTPGGPTATTIPSTGTATATPGSGGTGYCLNTDPTLDTTIWQVGGGTLSGGVATLSPGGSLFSTVPSDQGKSYYVHVVAKSDSSAQAVANWRSSRIPFAIPVTTYSQVTIPFPAETMKLQTRPLDQSRSSTTFVSPLSLEQLYFSSPLQRPEYTIAAGDILVIENASSGNIMIESVCVTENTVGDGTNPDTFYDVDVFYPVCESDYVIQAAYDETLFTAMRVGPGDRSGMPVHAILPGTVLLYGDWLSFVFGGETFDNCAVIDHSALLNLSVQSIYCGVSEWRIPASNAIIGGSLIGYAGVTDQDNLLMFALQVSDEWVNPDTVFEVFGDCYPYLLIVEPLDSCAAEGNGNDLIPPRFNEPFPGWRIAEIPSYFPWLVKTVYDYVGYPILCALVPLINFVVQTVVSGANALIASLAPVFIFLYRVSMLFEYVLGRIRDLINGVFKVISGLKAMQACFKSILSYFLEAIQQAGNGLTDLENMFTDDTILFGITAISQLLLNSRVASYILWPLTILFIGYSAWKVLPWAYKQLRQAIGLD